MERRRESYLRGGFRIHNLLSTYDTCIPRLLAYLLSAASLTVFSDDSGGSGRGRELMSRLFHLWSH